MSYDNTPDVIKKDRDWFDTELQTISPELKVIDVVSDEELHCNYFILGKESFSHKEQLLAKLLRTDRYSIIRRNYKFPVKFGNDGEVLYETEESTLAIMRESYPLEEGVVGSGIRKKVHLSYVALWVLVIALIVYKFMEWETQ